MPGKNDDLISQLDYKEAVSTINLKIIDKNHKLLDSSLFLLKDSVLICEIPEIEIIPMPSNLFYVEPDYLINATDPNLIEIAKNIEIYKRGYEELCQQINNNTSKQIESMKKLISPSNNLIKEIIKLIGDFENTVKNLCIPFISEKEGLDTIDTNKLSLIQKKELNEDRKKVEKDIEAFKMEANNLNEKYKILFKEIYIRIQAICDSIKEIPSSIEYLQNTVEDGMTKYEEVLEELNDQENIEIFKGRFGQIKESYDLIKNIVKNVLEKIKGKEKSLNEKCNTDKTSLDSLKEERANIIKVLKLKSDSITNNIKESRKKYGQMMIQLPEIYISDLITEQLSKSMEDSVNIIKKENTSMMEGVNQLEIIISDVISKKSLDLLFIMDTTGSMEQYVIITKEKIINILDGIKKKCLDLIINLGFIGYKDVIEIHNKKCLDIGFDQDYDYVKEKIKSIVVGGGDDTAEDVSWAFERAIEKEWSSNCKIAILVTDAPCHGIKYHDKNLMDNYPNGVVGRRNIEEMVDQMAKSQINLICIELKKDTEKMFKIFEDIYKKNNCLFDVVPINSPELLINKIAEKASAIFKNNYLKN